MHAEVFAQSPYRCRLDWGRHGARAAAERQDILVIVDTLSFSTAVVTAVQRGGLVYPCAEDEQPGALAQRIGGEVAVRRKDVPAKGRFSLSPLTYLHLTPGTRIVLASPNGATCSRYARAVPFLFVGASTLKRWPRSCRTFSIPQTAVSPSLPAGNAGIPL